MSAITRLVSVACSAAILVAGWIALDLVVITPKRLAEAEIADLIPEMEAVLHRGQAALQTLENTPQFEVMQEPSAGPIADLHRLVRDAVVSVGGDLISSQVAADVNRVLIRARLSEEELLKFSQLVEAGGIQGRFISLEVYPVPALGAHPSLEVTALIGAGA
jgi:hypothetical protein